jgi:hypothetical protein
MLRNVKVRIDGRDFDENLELYELVNLKRKLGIIIFISVWFC